MVDVVAFFVFTVLSSAGLLAAIGLSGYEIYRIGEYRLLFVILLLGLMLQHQILEWLTFASTGQVAEQMLGEIFETTANLVASGGVYYLLALLRRERTLTEKQRRREREFESMVSSAPTPMLYHCPNQIRLVNDAALSMLEVDDEDELLGRSLTEFVVDEDRELVEAGIAQSGDWGASQSDQVTLETVEGDRRYAVFSAEPLHFDGFDGVQITLNDITERERSRAELEQTKDRLQTLFHNIQNGVLVIDMDTERIIDANDPACEMLGYTKSELTDLRPAAIHPHELDQLEAFLTTVQREEAVVTEGLSCRRKDGGTFAAEISAGVTRVDGARWLLVSIRNVTERKQRKQQIDFLNRLFRHNVRNRMNVVVGNANQIKEEGAQRVAEMAERIKSVGDRFVETSEKVRQITQVLKDGVRLEVDETDVSAVVTRLVERYRDAEPGARFETAIEDGVTIRGDASVRIAVDNLLENAVEHAGENPAVRVSVRRHAADDRMAEITVEDDGPGIPETERIVTADPEARSQLQHGSGIGLHLIAQTVSVYGGEFDITCPSEGGTRATITLPLATETATSAREGDPGPDVEQRRP
ncbi:MAG: PAS domain S-box protein [Haloarculaceae archaeon]